MPIRRETQYYIECDECGESTISAMPRKYAMKEFRDYGFTIGKKCLCENCSPNLKSKNNNPELLNSERHGGKLTTRALKVEVSDNIGCAQCPQDTHNLNNPSRSEKC